MRRILEKLASIYPDLREKKVLIIDDEADYASVSFRKHAEAVEVGRISSQIDEVRKIVKEADYLQVTATPYSLYLQPTTLEDKFEFLPKRPAFTVLLPIHKKYIGGKRPSRYTDPGRIRSGSGRYDEPCHRYRGIGPGLRFHIRYPNNTGPRIRPHLSRGCP